MSDIPDESEQTAVARYYGVDPSRSLLHPAAMTHVNAMNSPNALTHVTALTGADDINASQVENEVQETSEGGQTMTSEHNNQVEQEGEMIGDQYLEVSSDQTIDHMLADMMNNMQSFAQKDTQEQEPNQLQ